MGVAFRFTRPDFDIGEVGGEIRRQAEEIAEEYIYQQQELAETILSTAYARGISRFKEIIDWNFERALEQAPEYAYAPLANRLRANLRKDGFIRIYGTLDWFDVELDVDNILGSEAVFWAGVFQVRDMLPRTKQATKAQRDAYWRNVVYASRDADIGYYESEDDNASLELDDVKEAGNLYDNTIKLRLQAWGGLSPYWFLLEYGNDGEGAFPTNDATNFLSWSSREIKSEMEDLVRSVSDELGRNINTSLLNFLDNPYSAEPRDVFLQFRVEGTPYNLYVTPTRQLGLAQRIR